MEYNSDKEFYSTYLEVHDILMKLGWKAGKLKRDKKSISSLYTKDGFGMYILYGCEEAVRNEII